jgi:hypothetical protein
VLELVVVVLEDLEKLRSCIRSYTHHLEELGSLPVTATRLSNY